MIKIPLYIGLLFLVALLAALHYVPIALKKRKAYRHKKMIKRLKKGDKVQFYFRAGASFKSLAAGRIKEPIHGLGFARIELADSIRAVEFDDIIKVVK